MAESLATFGAHKGLLAGVDTLVLSQVTKVVKMAATVATLVTSLQFDLLFHMASFLGEACSIAGLGSIDILHLSVFSGLSAAVADRGQCGGGGGRGRGRGGL